MRLRPSLAAATLRARLAAEEGFTMLIALGVMTVVMLLVAAAFVAANGDIHQSQHDLEGKRAYYAARAGINVFMSRLNQDTELWTTCPSQSTTAVPGSKAGATFSYVPVPAPGQSACSTTAPAKSMIDANGSFSMRFTGNSGTNPTVTRSLIATFRRNSLLDYLWYTTYETLDPNTYSNPASYQDCATFYRDNRPSHCTRIDWITGDVINGPMYTQDQFSICGAPVFGRAGANDPIVTEAPSNGTYSVSGCSNNAVLNSPMTLGISGVGPPPDNTALLGYAQQDGLVLSGSTTIVLNGNNATVTNAGFNGGVPKSVSLTTDPIIYVTSSSCSSTYSPYNVSYTGNTGCGNVYVSGNYSTSVTIAAANDIIISGSITTNLSGSAVAGLVANNFIRVKHGVTTRSGSSFGSCGSASNISSQTLSNVVIDAAILALNHSFIVDNYDCGAPLGNLTVNGAMAQLFRGTVGTSRNGDVASGYLKNYNYDDRLKVQEPPDLFALSSTGWRIVRETSCVLGGTNSATKC